MKTKTGSAAGKAKTKSITVKGTKANAKINAKRPHSVPRAHVAKKAAMSARPKSTLAVMPKSGDSHRGFYLRFGTEKDGLGPTIKASVKAAADKAGVSMNEFAAAATMDWVERAKEGKVPPALLAAEKAEKAAEKKESVAV
jgi:hypothetical protein